MNELDALETDDLIPAEPSDSCHSSADEPKAASRFREAAFSCPARASGRREDVEDADETEDGHDHHRGERHGEQPGDDDAGGTWHWPTVRIGQIGAPLLAASIGLSPLARRQSTRIDHGGQTRPRIDRTIRIAARTTRTMATRAGVAARIEASSGRSRKRCGFVCDITAEPHDAIAPRA